MKVTKVGNDAGLIADGQTNVGQASPSQADQIRQTLSTRSVCPFCGQESDRKTAVCTRCNLENSPGNRQTARSRIGPWHLYNVRNPGARGMRFDLLLALVRTGKVGPSAIVRGPTTHQLWRYAAKVRGLSREWGICFACGGSIETTATTCPHCHRSQEPPVNPNTLVDAEAAQSKPIQVDLSTAAPQPAPARPDATPEPAKSPETTTAAETSPSIVIATPEKPGVDPVAAALTRANPAPTRPSLPRPTDDILTAKDLASAFRLTVPAQPPQSADRRRFRPLRAAAMFFLLLGLAAAAVLWARPDWRGVAQAWASERITQVEAMINQSRTGQAAPATPEPPQPERIPELDPVAEAAPEVAPEPEPQAETPATRPAEVVTVTPPPQPETPQAVEAEPKPSPETNAGAKPSPWDELMKPDPAPAGDAANRTRAITLFRAAIEAEAREEFDVAVKYYEDIKKLPQEVWPGGLQIRLDRAKKRLGS
jgi:hypothetical protein